MVKDCRSTDRPARVGEAKPITDSTMGVFAAPLGPRCLWCGAYLVTIARRMLSWAPACRGG